ncbi:NAD(P)/FAD-dependent oxidoreductase [Actinomadura sp. WAC 06369]|uniref:NAD(P)/FAD-dependent oxidoreductase n=1 Tax=Actinomadura sp. WAC 06369 TaxID=2203193 RepID=UPI000F7879C6|nr:FAD-dependent oxidoreductase [Actinomadura sp. WAC 06369]RSN71828.1 FAD-dependent oxidoreductase [Actinomadura sp. WAC 06369]
MHVVVIGGGYAGVMAADRLTQRADVTLVNPRPRFVERVRLHRLAAGTGDAVADFGDVLADGVRLVVGTAAAIDADRCRVVLADGAVLEYDYLVYAVGSGAAPGVPGAAGFAYPVASLEEAGRLRDAVAGADSATVVGGGPLGIETAAELAETGRDVTLVCGGRLGPYLHPRGRRAVARELAKLGVTVLEEAVATSVDRGVVRLSDGRELPGAVPVWAAGFAVPDLAARSGLTTDAAGRLATDETLTSVDDVRIVAAGDAAAPSGAPLRMSCQAALPLGSHAADTVLARIAGEAPKEFGKGIAAMCVSLGRRAGVFQLAHRDDTATWFHVGGRLGARLKESACASPVKQLAKEARAPGSHTWPVKDASRRRPPAAGAAVR